MLLWDVLARSSAVLAAAALISVALRGRSAALRHAVWACGLAGALAVAPLSWVLPTWHVPLVPAAPTADAALPEPAPALEQAVQPPVAPLQTLSPTPAPAATPTPARAPAATPTATPIEIPWRTLLLGLWALGTIGLLCRLAFANVLTLRALRGDAGPAPWLGTARRLAAVSGVPDTRFVRSETITMPMAAGYLRPTVVLPVEADAWPDERLTSVLLHELAHVRRRDCLTQLAASTTCALYWMNPLAWYAARALRRERERACDDAVLAAGTAGPEYAEHLLDVARAARQVTTPTFSGGVAMAHRSELEGRLMAILDDARNRQSLSYGAAGLAGILCLALVTPLAALDPWVLGAAEAQAVAIPPGPEDVKTPKAPKAPRPATRPVAIAMAAPAVAPIAVIAPAAPVVAAAHVDVDAHWDANADVDVEFAMADVPVPPVPPVPPAAISLALQAALPTPAPSPSPSPSPSAKPSPGQEKGPARANRERTPADPRVIAALAGALKDTDVEVRQQAAHSLGQMRDPAAAEALIPALQDTDVEVRQNVVFALGQLRDVRAIPGLTIALKDTNEEVRERAAFALAQLRDPRAIDPLLIATKDANNEVRRQALFAIAQIDAARGKDAAIEALKDKDAEVRRMAAHLLGRLARD
jgi:HEAT repeat protein